MTFLRHTTHARQAPWPPAASVGTAGNDHVLRHAAAHHACFTLRESTRLWARELRGPKNGRAHLARHKFEGYAVAWREEKSVGGPSCRGFDFTI